MIDEDSVQASKLTVCAKLYSLARIPGMFLSVVCKKQLAKDKSKACRNVKPLTISPPKSSYG